MSVADKLQVLREKVDPAHARLIAVTKYATIPQMREAYQAGVRCFGENKVQEALDKMDAFPSAEYPDLTWHFIGHMQTNKIRKAIGRFELIHSVDSVHLAQKISDQSQEFGCRQDILLQVNLQESRPDRFGFDPHELPNEGNFLTPLPGIRLRGLMTMAPPSEDPALLRSIFCGLRDLRNRLEDQWEIDLPELSMGMSQDFIHALQCGATIIRIGSYLFQN